MKTISIIGAGPAGIEAAAILSSVKGDLQSPSVKGDLQSPFKITIFEKSDSPLRNITDKAFLFPNFADANEIANQLNKKLMNPAITQHLSTEIVSLKRDDNKGWKLTDSKGQNYFSDLVLLATGYTPFDAHRKEELGYGIYNGVITSLDMEKMIRYNKIENTICEKPRRVVFLQCVGSRDEKSGNHYCSKLCCVTAVKQAIELKKQLPDTEAYIFYMDLRMWGQHFEELYRQSQQEYGVRYVRGRISEASGTFDGRVQIKAEDTLMGLPLKMTADLLVLMVGMEASSGTSCLAKEAGICGDYGFAQSIDPHLGDNLTEQEGLYICGTCKRPMTIVDTIADARSAATVIANENS